MVVLATLGLTAFFVYGVVATGRATDEASQAKTAADAAALGAAHDIHRFLVEWGESRWHADSRDSLFSLLDCSLGEAGAADYAERNGAVVTSYCYNAASDLVEVEVAMRDPGIGGSPARAASAASVGWSPAGCRWDDDELPPPPPPPPVPPVPLPVSVPPPVVDPEPVRPPGTWLRCRGVSARLEIGPDGRMKIVPPGWFRQQLTPRLER